MLQTYMFLLCVHGYYRQYLCVIWPFPRLSIALSSQLTRCWQDALSKTVPIWTAVLNRAVAAERGGPASTAKGTDATFQMHPPPADGKPTEAETDLIESVEPAHTDWDCHLHLPPWIAQVEHGQICSRVDGWVQQLQALQVCPLSCVRTVQLVGRQGDAPALLLVRTTVSQCTPAVVLPDSAHFSDALTVSVSQSCIPSKQPVGVSCVFCSYVVSRCRIACVSLQPHCTSLCGQCGFHRQHACGQMLSLILLSSPSRQSSWCQHLCQSVVAACEVASPWKIPWHSTKASDPLSDRLQHNLLS